MVRPQLSYMEKQHCLPTVSQFCFLLTLKLLFDKQVCSVLWELGQKRSFRTLSSQQQEIRYDLNRQETLMATQEQHFDVCCCIWKLLQYWVFYLGCLTCGTLGILTINFKHRPLFFNMLKISRKTKSNGSVKYCHPNISYAKRFLWFKRRPCSQRPQVMQPLQAAMPQKQHTS